MLRLLLFSFLFISNCSYSQKINKETGSNISTEDAQMILDHHNMARKEVGTAKLSWSKELAAYAQVWANYLADSNKCNIKHRQEAGKNYKSYGENIFEGSSADAFKPVDASYSWYNEKKNYKYKIIGEGTWYKTGHYTQMIWKDTKEIGVGVAVCPNKELIVVANYYPAGNYIGEYPY
jgi:uncharacterized protein YkwD